jgi:agmatine deiminase
MTADARQPLRMPAEWEPHRATWIAWPHFAPDWPGKLALIPWVYGEIARVLTQVEPVEILCDSEEVRASAQTILAAHAVRFDRIGLHIVPTDRTWLRDSAPTAVKDADGRVILVNWGFNAWAKYPNYQRDAAVGAAIEQLTALRRLEPTRHDTGERIVLEGGGIDVNGDGLLLVTEEWLLSEAQVRNPGLTRRDYEALFAEWLGVRRAIWLGEGCAGDDTHGHVDDIARFVSRETVVLAVEPDPADDNHRKSMDNLRRLELAGRDPAIGPLRVVTLPFPRNVVLGAERLPASYANFYIANGVVVVPTFNDVNDRVALNTLADLMPQHQVIGLNAVDLVLGLGTLHCLTQQEPESR